MKTQDTGVSRGPLRLRPSRPWPSLWFCWMVAAALKNYRENRENGFQGDAKNSPLSGFPSRGFEALDMTKWDTQSGKWPDAGGRYWHKLSLRDEGRSALSKLIFGNERVESGFYYEKDKARGFPKKDAQGNDVWWFIIGHADGTRITGFCQEPDYSQGFPRNNGDYYYNFKFYESECAPIRQWMEEKDLNYLRRIKCENSTLFQKEFEELKAINPLHPAISQLLREEAKAEEKHLVEETTSLSMPASSTSLATSSSSPIESAAAATQAPQSSGYSFGTSHTLFAAPEIEIIPEVLPASSVPASSDSSSDHAKCCCLLS